MKYKFIDVYMLDHPDQVHPKEAGEVLINTMHIKSIDEHPASDDDKISFGLKFKNKKMIDTVCDLHIAGDHYIRIPYTKAEFLKKYKLD